MAEVGALRISVGLNTAEVTSGIKSLNQRLNALNSELRAVSTGASRFDNSLQALRARADVLNRTMQTHQRKVAELRRRYEESKATKGEDAAETIRLANAYNRAVAAMNTTERRLQDVTQEIKQQSSAWYRLRQRMEDTGQRMQDVGGRMQSAGAEITQTFGASLAAIGAGLGFTAKKAMDFESQMSSVKSVMSPDEVNQFGESLEQLAKKMGAETKYSSLEAAQGIEELIKAGVSVTDIINGGLEGALSLATAGELGLAEAAEIASTALNAFKDDNLSVIQAADLLAGAANASATSVSEMQHSLAMVSAVASGIGLSFKDTTTALAVFAQNGLKGSDAGTSLKTMLLNLSPSTKEASKKMKELGLLTEKGTSAFFNANGSIKSVAEIADLLRTKLSHLNEEQRQNALRTMFGADAIRAANILYKEGAKGITNMAEAMTKIKSADVAATKLDNVKGRIEQLKGSLETAAISLGNALLPTIDKVVAKVQKMTDWFNKLSPEMRENIVQAGLAAAGFTAVATAIGIGLSVAGAAISGFGALAASLGAIAGPAALAAIGIGAVAGLVVSVKNDFKKAKEVNLEHAESLIKQQQALEGLTTRFQELSDKNKLSTDELMRFRDIQSELKFAKSAEEIAKLKDEQAKLQEKSGLTNEELSEMISLNDEIIKKAPEVDRVYSDRGNAIITNKDALNEVNGKLRENIQLELENQRIKAEAKLDQHIRDYITALDELKAKEAERDEAVKVRNELEQELTRLRIEAQNQLNAGKDAEAEKTIEEIANTEILLNQQNQKVLNLAGEVEEKQKSVEKSQEEIEKTQELYEQMINLQLAQAGINAKGAEGIAQLDDAIAKTQKRIEELYAAKEAQGGLNSEQQEELSNLQQALGKYQSTKTEIQKIQGEQQTVNTKIQEGTNKAQNMNTELGKNVNKNVTVDDKGKADELNEKVGKAITKKVTLKAIWSGVTAAMKAALPFFAKGTKYAPGGPSVVGEAGRELTYFPNRGLALVNGPTLLNLPRGAKVIPNRDTERILRSWNIPKLASGGITISEGWAIAGERGREIVDLRGASVSNQTTSPLPKQPVLLQLLMPNERVMAEWLVDDITALQEFKANRIKVFG